MLGKSRKFCHDRALLSIDLLVNNLSFFVIEKEL